MLWFLFVHFVSQYKMSFLLCELSATNISYITLMFDFSKRKKSHKQNSTVVGGTCINLWLVISFFQKGNFTSRLACSLKHEW